MSPSACRAATARGFPDAFLARPRPGANVGTRSRRCRGRTARGDFRRRTVSRQPVRSAAMAPPWWRSAVFYQIYPRSFADGAGGRRRRPRRHRAAPRPPALARRRRRLAVAVLPRRRMADFGYDVADYCDVDPVFGDARRLRPPAGRRATTAGMQAARRLRAEPHLRPAPVVPGVPVEPRRPEARLVRLARRRRPTTPPNNWLAAFTDGPAWTWDEATGAVVPPPVPRRAARPQLGQPRGRRRPCTTSCGSGSTAASTASASTSSTASARTRRCPTTRPRSPGIPHSGLNDRPETHELLRGMRKLVDAYPGDRMIGRRGLPARPPRQVADVLRRPATSCTCRSTSRRCYTPWDGGPWRRAGRHAPTSSIDDRGAWPTWVLSNHDNARHRTRYGSRGPGPRRRVPAARPAGHARPLRRRGARASRTPSSRRERVVDPGGRDGCRAPIPWTGAPDHGWGVTDAWLPWPPDAGARNVEAQRADPASILHLYRRLLAARRASPALPLGGSPGRRRAPARSSPGAAPPIPAVEPDRATGWSPSTWAPSRPTLDAGRHGAGGERRRRRGRAVRRRLAPDHAVAARPAAPEPSPGSATPPRAGVSAVAGRRLVRAGLEHELAVAVERQRGLALEQVADRLAGDVGPPAR